MPKLPSTMIDSDGQRRACLKNDVLGMDRMIRRTEMNKKYFVKASGIRLDKLTIRDFSKIPLINTNLNYMKILLVVYLKNYLESSKTIPASLKQAYDIQIIEEILIEVEKFMILRLASEGIDKFNEWVNDEIMKLQSMRLFDNPESVRCAETIKLIKMEPLFNKRMDSLTLADK